MPLVAAHIPRPTKNESLAALRLALASISHHGLTSIHDPGIGLEEIPLLMELIDEDAFPIRSCIHGVARTRDWRPRHSLIRGSSAIVDSCARRGATRCSSGARTATRSAASSSAAA